MKKTIETWIDEENLLPFLTMVGLILNIKIAKDEEARILEWHKQKNDTFNYIFSSKEQNITLNFSQQEGSSNYDVQIEATPEHHSIIQMAINFCQCYRVSEF